MPKIESFEKFAQEYDVWFENNPKVYEAEIKKLPLESETYDCTLMVTAICFVDDPMQSLKEIYRILTPGGFFIIGFIEINSAIGKLYEKNHQKSRFYKEATFFTTKEVAELLEKSGFVNIRSYQTLFGNTLEDVENTVKEGSNGGAFIVTRAKKVKNENFTYEQRKQ